MSDTIVPLRMTRRPSANRDGDADVELNGVVADEPDAAGVGRRADGGGHIVCSGEWKHIRSYFSSWRKNEIASDRQAES